MTDVTFSTLILPRARPWPALLFGLLTGLASLAQPAQASPPPARIADLWFAHNATTALLGAAGRVVITVDTPVAQPWLYRLSPAMRSSVAVNPGPANAEALLAGRVNLTFVAQKAEADRLRRLGVPAVSVAFTDLKSMRASMTTTANALGDPFAQARLEDYNMYLDEVLARLGRELAHTPAEARPRVLHIASTFPLRADGAGTLIDDWITLAGGRNAAVGLHGALQPISVEQIARWNPDIIIVGGSNGLPDPHPMATIPELRGRRIVRNPTGAYQWDRYGPEFVLQLQWAAKLLHPELFGSIDMTRETVKFYRRFFHYPLSREEAERMLSAQPPAPLTSLRRLPG